MIFRQSAITVFLSLFQLHLTRAVVSFVAGAFLICATVVETRRAQTAPLPSLNGEKAIKQLKQTGGYNSLVKTVKAARQQSGQTDDLSSPEAVRQAAKLTAADGAAGDQFGVSVAISGNRAIVGANFDDIGENADQGSAYVFARSGSSWMQTQKLFVPTGDITDFFGESISASGDFLIIGAPNGANNSESASNLLNTRRGISLSAYLLKLLYSLNRYALEPSDGEPADRFGTSVSTNGNTTVVGATGRPGGINNAGAAYVFTRSGNRFLGGETWTQQAKLTRGAGIGSRDGFGQKVKISGNTIVISASGETVGGNSQQGAVYVFVGSGSNWTLQQRLTSADGAALDNFGQDVGISGDTIVVGAPRHNLSGIGDQGAAYVFTRSGNVWSQQQKLTASDAAVVDLFGVSAAIDGNNIVAGAIGDDIGRGSAYLFTRSGATWTQRQKLTASDGAVNDNFGSSIDINGDKILVAALFDDIGANANQGSAYLFTISGSTPFDFDGDGKADLAVFRPSNGAWYLQQSTAGFAGVGFGLGSDLITPADFDGDGKSDIAVFRPSNGAWYYLNSSNGQFGAVGFGQNGDIPLPADFDGDGRADINVFRPANGAWYRLNSSNGQFVAVGFGQNGDVPLAADFDGDGKSDIAVFRPSAGAFYWLNSSNGQFNATQFGIGTDIPTMADFDGDGKTDIGVFRPANGAWYYLNSSNGQFVAVGFGQNGDVPVAADYDGDGKADIAVFRNGIWYLLRSQQGFTGIQFGAANDKPIPAFP